MSSPGTSNGTVKEPHTGHKHNLFKTHKHGKKSTLTQEHEEAPLLADGAPNEDMEADAVEECSARQPAKKQGNAREWFQKVGRWLWSNRMILAIALLLMGGIIALIVYFTGMCGPLNLLLFSSICCSWLPPRITI